MTHTPPTPPPQPTDNPHHVPALTLRHRRRWHGGSGISQRELARRVGLTARQLYRYEHRTVLPEPVRRLLMLATALGLTVEDLVQPSVLEAVRADVAARTDAGEAGPL